MLLQSSQLGPNSNYMYALSGGFQASRMLIYSIDIVLYTLTGIGNAMACRPMLIVVNSRTSLLQTFWDPVKCPQYRGIPYAEGY